MEKQQSLQACLKHNCRILFTYFFTTNVFWSTYVGFHRYRNRCKNFQKANKKTACINGVWKYITLFYSQDFSPHQYSWHTVLETSKWNRDRLKHTFRYTQAYLKWRKYILYQRVKTCQQFYGRYRPSKTIVGESGHR